MFTTSKVWILGNLAATENSSTIEGSQQTEFALIICSNALPNLKFE
jgi:hypothetical protein